MSTPIEFYIRCNGTFVKINPDRYGGPGLDAEWGSEQCEGCGEDIITTGTLPTGLKYGASVRCRRCRTTYPIYTRAEQERRS